VRELGFELVGFGGVVGNDLVDVVIRRELER
jgi:hypothetical protein